MTTLSLDVQDSLPISRPLITSGKLPFAMQGKSQFWRLGQGHLWGLFFCLLYCIKQDVTTLQKTSCLQELPQRKIISFHLMYFLGPNIQLNILPPRKGIPRWHQW